MIPILVSVVTYVALIVLAPVVLWKSATRLILIGLVPRYLPFAIFPSLFSFGCRYRSGVGPIGRKR